MATMANPKSYAFALDSVKDGYIPVMHFVASDVGSNILTISLTQNLIPYPLTAVGLVISLFVAKADGSVSYQSTTDGSITITSPTGGTIQVVLASGSISGVGKNNSCEINVQDTNGNSFTFPPFTFEVLNNNANNVASGNSLIPLLQATNDAVTATTNANNKVTQINNETLIIYKPYVATFANIATTYPVPQIGWATQVQDVGTRYRWNGTAWVNIGVDSTNTVGDLSTLNTVAKDKIVNAINENVASLAAMTKVQVIQNTIADTQGPLDLKNFAQQGTANSPLSFAIHNYTDGHTAQFDSVGSGEILTLCNAHNATNRPDKPADFIGSGDFLRCMEYQVGTAQNLSVFLIGKSGEMIWTGIKGKTKFIQSKVDDGFEAYNFATQIMHNNFLKLTNVDKDILHINNDIPVASINTRTVIESAPEQTNGLLLKACSGSVALLGIGNILIGNVLQSTIGNLKLFGTTGTDAVECLSPIKLSSFIAANAQNNCLFVDVADNLLKFKNSTGTIKIIQVA